MKEQPEALRLAEHLENFRSFPDDLAAAAALRRLHERDVKADAQIKELLQIIEDFEHHTELLRQRVNELEEQLSAAQQGVRVPLSDELPQGFLSDVLTAAGLVSHGKQCKALGSRLGEAVEAIWKISISQREAISAHGIKE